MPLNAEGLKYEDVTLGDKTFRITEMPLQQADEWANACLFALVKGGLDIGNVNIDLIKNTINPKDGELRVDPMGGILELAKVSLTGLGNISKEVGQPLLNQLIYDCVTVVPSGGVPRPLLGITKAEIGELDNLWKLRIEAFKIHVGFLAPDNS